jgi:hypothetical protein
MGSVSDEADQLSFESKNANLPGAKVQLKEGWYEALQRVQGKHEM